MNRTRALIICAHPSDYVPTRVLEAAKHLLAQGNVSEEEKQLAPEARKSFQLSAEPMPQPQRTRASPRPKTGVSARESR